MFEFLPRRERISPRRTPVGGGLRNIDVDVVTLASFIDTHGLATIDPLKGEMEGAEIDALRSLKDDPFARIGQMTIERRRFMKPSAAPPVEELFRGNENQMFFANNARRKILPMSCALIGDGLTWTSLRREGCECGNIAGVLQECFAAGS